MDKKTIRPYWSSPDGRLVIYHGAAENVLPSLPASSVDVLLTDPPYGQDYQSNRRPVALQKIANDDGTLDLEPILRSALRCLRRGRHVYIFGPLDVSELPLASPVELIWDKGIVGTGALTVPWALSHERITFAVYEISKANREKGYGKLTARLRRGSILRHQRLQSGQVALHPNEKPVRLLQELIESSTVFEETVLDPFMGSGSTLEAAYLEGRQAIGIEIEERYCATAAERLERLVARSQDVGHG